MSSDPDDFDSDSDDDFDAPFTPSAQPPIAPQQKLPSLRGLGPNNVDDEFNEEDFDDDFDDDFEEELEDDYPFEVELGGDAPVIESGDLDVDIEGDLNDDEVAVEPVEDAEETEE